MKAFDKYGKTALAVAAFLFATAAHDNGCFGTIGEPAQCPDSCPVSLDALRCPAGQQLVYENDDCGCEVAKCAPVTGCEGLDEQACLMDSGCEAEYGCDCNCPAGAMCKCACEEPGFLGCKRKSGECYRDSDCPKGYHCQLPLCGAEDGEKEPAQETLCGGPGICAPEQCPMVDCAPDCRPVYDERGCAVKCECEEGCESDAGCPQGYYCEMPLCGSAEDGADVLCEGGKGRCAQYPCPPFACPADCARIIDERGCVVECDCDMTCHSDRDCPEGYRCELYDCGPNMDCAGEAGFCRPDACPEIACADGCVPVYDVRGCIGGCNCEMTCESARDCPEGYYCERETWCETDPNGETWCADNISKCVPEPCAEIDCAEGCRPIYDERGCGVGCRCSQCRTDEDCANMPAPLMCSGDARYECIGGVCQFQCFGACSGLDEQNCVLKPACEAVYEYPPCPPCDCPDGSNQCSCGCPGPMFSYCKEREIRYCSSHWDCADDEYCVKCPPYADCAVMDHCAPLLGGNCRYDYQCGEGFYCNYCPDAYWEGDGSGSAGDGPDEPMPPEYCNDWMPPVCEPIERGCHSNADCGPEMRCTANEECLSDPNCPQCDVCYGRCVESPLRWVMTQPVSCGMNPWEQVNTVPAECMNLAEDDYEACVIMWFFGTVGIDIYDLRDVYLPGAATCAACSCPRGDTLYLLVEGADAATLVAAYGFQYFDI